MPRSAARKASSHAHYERNRETILARQRERYRLNREALLKYQQGYREANREKIAKRDSRYKQRRAEILSAYNKEYRGQNATAIREYERARAADRRSFRRQAPGSSSQEQIEERFAFYGNCCAYCGAEGELHVDHVIPLIRGGSNWPANLRPACPTCNMSKGAKLLSEWRGRCA